MFLSRVSGLKTEELYFYNNIGAVKGSFSGAFYIKATKNSEIFHSIFESNFAEQGGAIRALINTNVHLKNVTFFNNTAKNNGGVLKLD